MIKRLLDIIYPRRCVLCLSSSQASKQMTMELCDACQAELQVMTHACSRCGIALTTPSTSSQTKAVCGQCLQKPPRYDRVVGIYHYQQPLVWLIQQMKFHKKLLIARLLSQLMAVHLKRLHANNQLSIPDAIIPVPLHHKRQHERHFNQAEELAFIIEQTFPCTLDTQYIERGIDTQKQSGLDAKQRRKNIKGAFKLKNKPSKKYRHVAIIDDVMSTGSTVNEIARVLKKSGIKKVDVWVLARASKD